MHSFHALIHNPATQTRDVQIRYEASKEVVNQLKKLTVGAVGAAVKPFKSGEVLTLAKMHPGENRWIQLSCDVPRAVAKQQPLLVAFHVVEGGKTVNGFTLAIVPIPTETAQQKNLQLHAQVLGHLAAVHKTDTAKADQQAALKLLAKKPTAKEHVDFVKLALKTNDVHVTAMLDKHAKTDPLGLKTAQADLDAAAKSGDADKIAAAHRELLHRMDTHLQMARKAEGNTADILQNMRWQADLYANVPQLKKLAESANLVKQANDFVTAYGQRKLTNKDYPNVVKSALDGYRKTAQALPNLKLDQDIAAMEKAQTQLVALQKAQHDYLLKVNSLVK
jgi:hypothetical protein